MARGLSWTEEQLAAYNARKLDAPAPPLTDEPESRFMARVLTLARAQGWLAFHPYRSDKSTPGWPDLVLAKPGQPLLLIETKTNTGKLTIEQVRWLGILQQTEKPLAAVWRPRDWQQIADILGGKHG